MRVSAGNVEGQAEGQPFAKLQAALHAKAKGSPTYPFYALYDKV